MTHVYSHNHVSHFTIFFLKRNLDEEFHIFEFNGKNITKI